MPNTKVNPRIPRYPWEKWLKGSPIVITKGKDYPGSTSAFVINLRRHAKERGYRVVVNVLDGDSGIAFYAVRLNGKYRKSKRRRP